MSGCEKLVIINLYHHRYTMKISTNEIGPHRNCERHDVIHNVPRYSDDQKIESNFIQNIVQR